MTLEEKLSIARQAGAIISKRWRDKVEVQDAYQEAYLIALEKPDGWWDKHTHSFLLQSLANRVWARLIRKRYFAQGGDGKLRRVVEFPWPDSLDDIPRAPKTVHLGDWT